MLQRFLSLVFALPLAATVAGPQQPSQARVVTSSSGAAPRERTGPGRPIEATDIAAWKSIGTAALSRNGEWFAYTLMPNEGDADLVVRSTRSDKLLRFPIGESRRTGSSFAFSHDGRWLAYAIAPHHRDAERLRRDKKPLQDAAAVVELSTGTRVEFPGVKSFSFDGKRSRTLALFSYPETPSSAAGARAPAASAGADLILYDLASSLPLNIGNVGEYAFDRSGTWIAWTVDARDEFGNGVRLRNLETGSERALDGGRAVYRGLAWADSSSDMLALLKGRVDSTASDTLYQLLGYTGISAATPSAFSYRPSDDSSFPAGMTLGTSRPLRWSEDRGTVFFGLRPIRSAEERPAKAGPDAVANPDKPTLILWHWKEPRLESQQQVERARDEAFTYLAEYRLADRKFIRIADDSLPDVVVAPKDRWAIAWDDRAYATGGANDGREYADLHVIDVATGARKRVLSRYLLVNGFARVQYYSLSPDGVHLLTWSDGAYTVRDMATGQARPLVAEAGLSFVDVGDDHPRSKPPIMPVAWSEDGGTVLLTDKWDIWGVPLNGGRPVNLTGNGKKDGIRYSGILSALTPNTVTARTVDLDKPWYVGGRAEWTKESGIVRVNGRSSGAQRMLWGDASFNRASKAADADVLAYTRETALDFPNYYLSDLTFASGRQVTDANPQQRELAWPSGTVVVDYLGPKGERLQASLLLPANYEKGKQYPAVMHIYEHRSQNRNAYESPSYVSALNGSLYASRGYVVISPDIDYKVDAPGTSSVKSVLAAARAAIATGIVDSAHLGITGHSWGGYQTAFIITQTPLFKAAVAGAAPTDMISFYGDIYWNTGRMIAPIFESDQARFATPYWENMEAYVRESAVFHARNVTTPLLLLQNDKDGAVDWHQGIEYYNVLRRLSKPVVMLEYVGENHGLAVPANQKDYAMRMQEFFDYYLKDGPAPLWWTEGVPLRKMDEHLKSRQIAAPRAAVGSGGM